MSALASAGSFMKAKKQVICKHEVSSIYRDKMIHKGFLLIMKFYRAEIKNLESGASVAWNCSFLPGAGAAFFAWSRIRFFCL